MCNMNKALLYLYLTTGLLSLKNVLANGDNNKCNYIASEGFGLYWAYSIDYCYDDISYLDLGGGNIETEITSYQFTCSPDGSSVTFYKYDGIGCNQSSLTNTITDLTVGAELANGGITFVNVESFECGGISGICSYEHTAYYIDKSDSCDLNKTLFNGYYSSVSGFCYGFDISGTQYFYKYDCENNQFITYSDLSCSTMVTTGSLDDSVEVCDTSLDGPYDVYTEYDCVNNATNIDINYTRSDSQVTNTSSQTTNTDQTTDPPMVTTDIPEPLETAGISIDVSDNCKYLESTGSGISRAYGIDLCYSSFVWTSGGISSYMITDSYEFTCSNDGNYITLTTYYGLTCNQSSIKNSYPNLTIGSQVLGSGVFFSDLSYFNCNGTNDCIGTTTIRYINESNSCDLDSATFTGYEYFVAGYCNSLSSSSYTYDCSNDNGQFISYSDTNCSTTGYVTSLDDCNVGLGPYVSHYEYNCDNVTQIVNNITRDYSIESTTNKPVNDMETTDTPVNDMGSTDTTPDDTTAATTKDQISSMEDDIPTTSDIISDIMDTMVQDISFSRSYNDLLGFRNTFAIGVCIILFML